jgi:hypothetical protein
LRQLNWSSGLGRLWLVFAVLWSGGAGISILMYGIYFDIEETLLVFGPPVLLFCLLRAGKWVAEGFSQSKAASPRNESLDPMRFTSEGLQENLLTNKSSEIPADPSPIPPESSFLPRNRNLEQQSGRTLIYRILLVLIIAAGSGAAFWWRDTVVHHFPAANKVFMMVGFPANTLGYGLKIYEPKTFLDVKGKKRILGVTGQIMNETGKIIEVPLLKAILIGAKGEDLAGWSFEAKEPRILPGEKVEYETATENPPRGATGLRITFTRAEEETLRK